MLAYHLEINDESILDKVKAFFQTLPSNAVTLTAEKESFHRELENRLKQEIEAPTVASHQDVVTHIKSKYAFN
ncbi:MAG: hypothetical protein NT103_04450 [Campylobacterales bacterium]|nr:hypothetical protein [Campylobacterales bacterium]